MLANLFWSGRSLVREHPGGGQRDGLVIGFNGWWVLALSYDPNGFSRTVQVWQPTNSSNKRILYMSFLRHYGQILFPFPDLYLSFSFTWLFIHKLFERGQKQGSHWTNTWPGVLSLFQQRLKSKQNKQRMDFSQLWGVHWQGRDSSCNLDMT